jgi:hypothetical protein
MICKQVEEKKRLGLALIPLILGRIKVMFEEESRLQLKVCQQSAAHDGYNYI